MKKVISMLVALIMIVTTIFAQEGHYKNGHGSSHKGGKYKNAATNDHYRTRNHVKASKTTSYRSHSTGHSRKH